VKRHAPPIPAQLEPCHFAGRIAGESVEAMFSDLPVGTER
jgi:hypothetical protein